MNTNTVDARPAFRVKRLDGKKFTKTFVVKKKGKPFEMTTKREEGGFMVYFPKGHSIRVASIEEMERLGFNRGADIIDMESGEVIIPAAKLEGRQEGNLPDGSEGVEDSDDDDHDEDDEKESD